MLSNFHDAALDDFVAGSLVCFPLLGFIEGYKYGGYKLNSNAIVRLSKKALSPDSLPSIK